MSITYEEALETLQSMFGAPWSRDTLDAVLRHHGGHMENTIETVLTNGDRDPQMLVQQLKTGVSLDEEIARQLDHEERNATNPRGGAPAPPQRRVVAPLSLAPQQQREQRGTPTTLPPDFLRVPGRPIGSSSSNNNNSVTLNASSANTVDADEALARMLQDEFFAEELANNPEFAHLARGRPRTIGGMPARQSFTTPGMPQQQGRIGELPSRSFGSASQSQQGISRPGDQQDFNFMEKISELGDTAKRRLATLVAQFNASKNANQSRGGAGGTSGIAAERRSLLDDEEDAIEFMSRKDK